MERIKKFGTSLSNFIWMDAHIKAAPHKSYKDIKKISSYFKDGLPPLYAVGRDLSLPIGGVLLFVFFLTLCNSFLPLSPSLSALFVGQKYSFSQGDFSFDGALKLVGYALIQLVSMPLIFYALRYEEFRTKKFNYFSLFKERMLWYVYTLLILAFVFLVFVFSFLGENIFLSPLYLSISAMILKNLTHWMREFKFKRVASLGMTGRFFALIFPLLLGVDLFYTSSLYKTSFFQNAGGDFFWRLYLFGPLLQTLGVAVFIGLGLYFFAILAQLIQNLKDNPSNFKLSLERVLFESQIFYFLKKGFNVFRPIKRVFLLLSGFFTLFVCLGYGWVLGTQGFLGFSPLLPATKEMGQGAIPFFLLLSGIPILIHGAKILDPNNGVGNYFSYFTGQRFWRITYFLIRLILICAVFAPFPKTQEILSLLYYQLCFFVFCFCFIIPCITLAIGRSAAFTRELNAISWTIILLMPIPMVLGSTIGFSDILGYRGVYSFYERLFTPTTLQDVLILTGTATCLAVFFLYYVGVLSYAYKDILCLQDQGIETYKKEISLRKRV